MLLEEYIQEQIIALEELFLWKYMNDEEKELLRRAPNEAKANMLVHTYRNKYWDIMIKEFECPAQPQNQNYINMSILDMELKTKTVNSLMRHGLYTTGKFVEFVQKNGWSKIQGLGCGLCKELYIQIYEELAEEEIDKLVKETKFVKKKKDLRRK